MVRKLSKATIFDQKLSKMVILGQKWSEMVKIRTFKTLGNFKCEHIVSQLYKMVRNGDFWSKMV